MGALESCCDESSGQLTGYEALSKEQWVDPKSVNKAWQDCIISRNLRSLPMQLVDDERALESPVTLDGLNALLYYTDQCWLQGVQYLVEILKCDINFTHQRTGDTALHLAARYGYTKILIFLLGHGADPKIENVFGEIPEEVCLLKRDRKHFDAVAIQMRRDEAIDQRSRAADQPLLPPSDSVVGGGSAMMVHTVSLSQVPLDLGMALQSYRYIEEEKTIKRSIEERVFRDITDPENEEYFRYKSVQTDIARKFGIELDQLATMFKKAGYDMKFDWWLLATDHDPDIYERAVRAEMKGQSEGIVNKLASDANRVAKARGRRKGRSGQSCTVGASEDVLRIHAKYLPRIKGGHQLSKLLVALASRLKTQWAKQQSQVAMTDAKILMPLVKAKFTPDKPLSLARITLLESYLREQNPILMGYGFGDYTDESGAESEMDVAVMLEWSEKEIRQRRHKRRKKKARKKQELREEMMATHDGDGGDPMQFMDDGKSSMEIDERKRRMMPDGSTERVTVYEVLNGERIVELEEGRLSDKFVLSFDDFEKKLSEVLFYIHDELHIEWVKWNKAERKRARKEQAMLEKKDQERRQQLRKMRSLESDVNSEFESESELIYDSSRETASRMRSPSSSTIETLSSSADGKKKKKKPWYRR